MYFCHFNFRQFHGRGGDSWTGNVFPIFYCLLWASSVPQSWPIKKSFHLIAVWCCCSSGIRHSSVVMSGNLIYCFQSITKSSDAKFELNHHVWTPKCTELLPCNLFCYFLRYQSHWMRVLNKMRWGVRICKSNPEPSQSYQFPRRRRLQLWQKHKVPSKTLNSVVMQMLFTQLMFAYFC